MGPVLGAPAGASGGLAQPSAWLSLASDPGSGHLRARDRGARARSGYERVATSGCSDRSIRRRLGEWAAAGLAEQVHALALRAYDQIIGLELDKLAADGCITKTPGGGEVAGRSPVDRGKQGLKRSLVTDGAGIPLHVVAAGAN